MENGFCVFHAAARNTQPSQRAVLQKLTWRCKKTKILPLLLFLLVFICCSFCPIAFFSAFQRYIQHEIDERTELEHIY